MLISHILSEKASTGAYRAATSSPSFGMSRRPLDETCACMTCKKVSRAYLHNLVGKGIPFAAVLMTYHNIAYTQRLTKQIRGAIMEQRFPAFVRDFVHKHYPAGDMPVWVIECLSEVGIDVR